MKKIILIVSILFLFISLQSMEKVTSVKVGVFSHNGCKNKPQRDRYDIKNLDGAIGVGVFDGNGGSKVSQLLQEDFFHNFAYWLKYTKLSKSIKYNFKRAVKNSEFDATCNKGGKINKQGSSLLAAWLDPKSDKAHIVSVGESVAILMNNNEMSMTSLHRYADEQVRQYKVFRSIGNKNFKYKNPNILTAKSSFYEFSMQNFGYLILATKGLYDILNATDEMHRYKDFRKIFLDALFLSHDEFDKLYPLLSTITINSQEEASDSAEESSEELRYRYGLQNGYDFQNVVQDSTMQHIARRLVQVALSRGSKENITILVTSFE